MYDLSQYISKRITMPANSIYMFQLLVYSHFKFLAYICPKIDKSHILKYKR
jgi:hypothetical protein